MGPAGETGLGTARVMTRASATMANAFRHKSGLGRCALEEGGKGKARP